MECKGYSFFDVDGTLTNMRTMFAFNAYWYNKWLPEHGRSGQTGYDNMSSTLRQLELGGKSREAINRHYYDFFENRPVRQVRACVKRLYQYVLHMPGLFISETKEKLKRLRSSGVEPVFVSGSFDEVLQPLAFELNVRHVLCNRLRINGEHYTGELDGPQMIGVGKSDAIQDFMRKKGVAAKDCHAFGDHLSDLPMLESVNYPSVVAGDSRLVDIAKIRGWQLIAPNSRSRFIQ